MIKAAEYSICIDGGNEAIGLIALFCIFKSFDSFNDTHKVICTIVMFVLSFLSRE